MVTRNTYRILVWVIVILVATNLSMGISFWYHKQQDKKEAAANSEKIVMPNNQRARFFRDQLDLSIDQVNQFRDLNREYNRGARLVTDELEELRITMVDVMSDNNPSEMTLDSISTRIGQLHTQLKQLTIEYYLGMKQACDSAQQKKLEEIFITVSKTKEDVGLPRRGGRAYQGGSTN